MNRNASCRAFEGAIALYVEGDLGAPDSLRVEAHVQDCAACRELIGDLRSSLAMFKSLRIDAVNSPELAIVRERVLNEVGELEPAPGWVVAMHRLLSAGLRRKTVIAGAALAAVVSGSAWYAQTRGAVERPHEGQQQIARVEMPSISNSISEAPRQEFTATLTVVHGVDLAGTLPEEPTPAEVAEVDEVAELDDATDLPQEHISQIPIKFVTDDPNIIMYWIPADKGE